MAATILSEQDANGFVFARSDGEFEESLREAIEASNDEYAFRIQLEETLHLSNFTFDNNLQLADPALSSPVSNPSSSKDVTSSSFSNDEKEYTPLDYTQEDSGYGDENQGSSSVKEVDTELERRQCSVQVKKPVPFELCEICFEDSTAEMFEGKRCLHRFCHSCITKYIHMRLEQKRQQIYCPHDSCDELLTPQECGYFLPMEIIDAWSAIILEAEIPDSEKVYCPFPDCSAMLVNEDGSALSAIEILNAECPICNRMFCARCMVPWHAGLNCEEFQTLPPSERTEVDLQLFKLAEDRKWKRCSKCKRMIEIESGCNHMTCRCGYEFCYLCGTQWSGRPCNCQA